MIIARSQGLRNQKSSNYAVNTSALSSPKYKNKFSDITSKTKVNAKARETRRCVSLKQTEHRKYAF